jgi:hypothetical protein
MIAIQYLQKNFIEHGACLTAIPEKEAPRKHLNFFHIVIQLVINVE